MSRKSLSATLFAEKACWISINRFEIEVFSAISLAELLIRIVLLTVKPRAATPISTIIRNERRILVLIFILLNDMHVSMLLKFSERPFGKVSGLRRLDCPYRQRQQTALCIY